MIGAVLFFALPTALAYVLLARSRLVKSGLLRVAFAWFLGQYVSTLAVFVLAALLGLFTTQVLLKATILWVDALVLAALVVMPRARFAWFRGERRPERLKQLLAPSRLAAGLGIAGCLVFAILVFRPHLAYVDGQIYRSEVYWDLSIHYPMIQTFVYGDNFPPENESFAGVPMTYHFFFDLLTATYAAVGLDLVWAMQVVSVASLFVMLLTVAGLAIEAFGSSWVGAFAVVLCVTTGSFRFAGTLQSWAIGGIDRVLPEMLANTAHPYGFSVLFDRPVGYNGNMWNIFYWIAERQMIMAIIFLLFAAWVLLVVDRMPWRVALALGALLGLFLQWHLYVAIMVLAAMGWQVLWRRRSRGPEVALLIGYVAVVAVQLLYLKQISNGPWFLPEIHNYPRLNFEFASLLPTFPASPLHTVGFYVFGYGMRLVFLVVALVVLWRTRSPVLPVFLGIILPTFVLINTVQLSPLSVYDNHKWLKPMNVIIDLAVAFGVVQSLRQSGRVFGAVTAAPLVVVLTLSGFMELMPYLNSRPSQLYASYPTSAIAAIREHSAPRATFLGSESRMLHLGGRKMFLGNPGDEPGATSVVETEKFDVAPRQNAMTRIYHSESAADFCRLIAEHRIDYVEFNGETSVLPIFRAIFSFPRFEVSKENGGPVVYVDARAGCLQTPAG